MRSFFLQPKEGSFGSKLYKIHKEFRLNTLPPDVLMFSGEVLADTDSLEHLQNHVHVTLRKCAFLVEGRGSGWVVWDLLAWLFACLDVPGS